MTSSLHVADLKGDIVGLTIYPISLNVIAFILTKLWKGKIPHPLSRLSPRRQKKAGLDKIEILAVRSALDLSSCFILSIADPDQRKNIQLQITPVSRSGP